MDDRYYVEDHHGSICDGRRPENARVLDECEVAGLLNAKDAEIARLRNAIVWATDGEVRAETDGKRFFLMGPDIKGRVYFDGSEDDQIATVCRLAGGE